MRRKAWVAALLVLGACATSSPGKPTSRLETLRRDYPSVRYLIGIGEGATMELARRRAAVEIASQIGGSLHAEGWVEAETGRSDQGAIDRERVGESIRVETDFARMEWVEVVSARTQGDRVEVVAVLDRHLATRRLRPEVESEDAALLVEIQRVLEQEGLVAQARGLRELDRRRERLVSTLQLLTAISGGPISPPRALRAYERARDDVQAKLRGVEWEICVESASELGLAHLAGRLAAKGLLARACGAPPTAAERWRLEGELDAELRRMNQMGAHPYFCATRLHYRIGAAEKVEASGVAHGIRSGAASGPDACANSLQSLVTDFLMAIGWGSTEASR